MLGGFLIGSLGLFGSLLSLTLVVLVPIYLYSEAKRRGFPQPGWWILFGIFEPIVALMFFYAISIMKSK